MKQDFFCSSKCNTVLRLELHPLMINYWINHWHSNSRSNINLNVIVTKKGFAPGTLDHIYTARGRFMNSFWQRYKVAWREKTVGFLLGHRSVCTITRNFHWGNLKNVNINFRLLSSSWQVSRGNRILKHHLAWDVGSRVVNYSKRNFDISFLV